ncbi:hypothetical protein FJTKL_02824 [Diaporthe vaccinii]|uniref:Uncharacterized protein n=1 Tax=Diaporthe vaccinii TaxID=105482 RepID=A0ABR4F2M4_9PEZI
MAFIAGCNFLCAEIRAKTVASPAPWSHKRTRMYGSAGSARIDSPEKRQVVVGENGAGYFEVRFEGWKKRKSPIEWGRRKIGEAHDRDEEGSIKSPLLARGVERAR